MTRNAIFVTAFTVLLMAGCTGENPVGVRDAGSVLEGETAAKAQVVFPTHIPLPDGFQPEGIASGRGTTFFVGSLLDGSIYGGDLRTGEGSVLVSPPAGRVAVGLAYDARSNLLFVAGGATGAAFVYEVEGGTSVGPFQLTDSGTFVNDVVVTREAAYFTDSFRPYLYRIPLGAGGQLPDPGQVQEIELTGDYIQVAGFNANGIVATPDGKHLIIVNSATGTLYRVDPDTGVATTIDLGGAAVPSGDGLLLDGETLYVVQNFLNQIAVVHVAPDLSAGTVVRTITDDDFDIPTTVAEFGDALYAVNARFGTPATPETAYWVTRVSKR
jgi:sugar lactone lactonase YvrE